MNSFDCSKFALRVCIAHVFAFAVLSPFDSARAESVVSGAGFDYQPSVIRAADDSIFVVFERLNPSTLSGDLWLTRSIDEGESWSTPVAIIQTSENERHPALLQRADGTFVLFYLRSTGGVFKLFRATTAPDAFSFTEQGQLALGWPSGSEINPHVVQHADGTLTMSYQRLPGGSYLARSIDGGVSWDQQQTAIATNGVLPRVAYRESDARWFATYQVNPGNNQLQLFAKTTTDVSDWSASPTVVADVGDNHDSLPFVTPSGSLAVFYIHANAGQYDLYSRLAPTGLDFEPPIAQRLSAGEDDVQPHPLIADDDHAWIYWGREAVPNNIDYDIDRELRGVVDLVTRTGFED
jgi:hypothetical protein